MKNKILIPVFLGSLLIPALHAKQKLIVISSDPSAKEMAYHCRRVAKMKADEVPYYLGGGTVFFLIGGVIAGYSASKKNDAGVGGGAAFMTLGLALLGVSAVKSISSWHQNRSAHWYEEQAAYEQTKTTPEQAEDELLQGYRKTSSEQ